VISAGNQLKIACLFSRGVSASAHHLSFTGYSGLPIDGQIERQILDFKASAAGGLAVPPDGRWDDRREAIRHLQRHRPSRRRPVL